MKTHPFDAPRSFVLFALTVMLAVDTVSAEIITFGELSERPLEGVSVKGVTFHYSGGNSDLPQGLFGTTALSYGATTLMNAPWAAGSSDGMLRLDFANPVSAVSFDVGLSTTAAFAEGFRVNVYRGAQLANSIGVPTAAQGPSPLQFSESAFSLAISGAPFSAVSVTFVPGLNFVFDNLSYTLVPEPGMPGLGVAGLALAGMMRRRRSGPGNRNGCGL